MKKVLMAMISAIVIVIIIIIGFTIHGRGLRKAELSNALTASMENAMQLLLVEKGGPTTEEEWHVMFANSLAIQIESSSKLQLTIIESDMEKGYLKAEAILTWKHPIGTTGSISEVREILLEDYIEGESN